MTAAAFDAVDRVAAVSIERDAARAALEMAKLHLHGIGTRRETLIAIDAALGGSTRAPAALSVEAIRDKTTAILGHLDLATDHIVRVLGSSAADTHHVAAARAAAHELEALCADAVKRSRAGEALA
jgi:hypothetical protein